MSDQAFAIGDLHIGHLKAALARGFPTVEAHDEAIIERWNKVVRKRDTVWVLGDLLFGAASFSKLSRLQGRKKLVMGNHDLYPTERYLEHFVRLAGAIEVGGMLFTHIPVTPCQFERWPVNVHGHTHSRTLDDPRYICVSAEQTNLTPVPLEELRAQRDYIVSRIALD